MVGFRPVYFKVAVGYSKSWELLLCSFLVCGVEYVLLKSSPWDEDGPHALLVSVGFCQIHLRRGNTSSLVNLKNWKKPHMPSVVWVITAVTT